MCIFGRILTWPIVYKLSSPNALQSVPGANNCGFVHQGPGNHCYNVADKTILCLPKQKFLSERLQCLARKTTWSPLLPTLDFSSLAPLLFALRRRRLSSWIRGVGTIPLKIYLVNKVIFEYVDLLCQLYIFPKMHCNNADKNSHKCKIFHYMHSSIQVNRSCRVSWTGCFKN